MEITEKSRPRTFIPSSIDPALNPYGEGKTLIETLSRDLGIDISDADKATQAKYKAFTKHHPFLHPACALWFAKRCLAQGNKRRFREVVTTFKLTRLQGIVEGAGIVTSSLKNLPHVHQIEFATGCELTMECIAELCDVLKEKRSVPFELDLLGCITCCDALLSLSWAMPGLLGLAMLSISDPDVTDDGDWITALAAGLVHNPELLAFKLRVPHLTQEQAEALGEGCRSLTELHLECGNLSSLAHLLKTLGEKAPPDPDSPGTAARPLATLSIVGRPDAGQAHFSKGSVGFLRELIARCPSLKCVRISPSLHAQNFSEFEDVMALCGSQWKGIEIDVDFGLVTDQLAKKQPGEVIELETGRVIKLTLAYLRRKEASHRLLPEKELQGLLHRQLAAALQDKLLPEDVIHEISRRLVADRSPPASHLVTLNALSRTDKTAAALGSATALRRAHFERLKGLMTLSACAFGTRELADPLCLALTGWPLKGRLLTTEGEKALTSWIRTGRPDCNALENAIGEAEAHRWSKQKHQAKELLTCGFEDEFLAEQRTRVGFQDSLQTGFDITRLDMELSDAADRLRLKRMIDGATKTVSKAIQLFKNPWGKND
ncbi:hypothetical protein [Rhizobacter sp. P5_C2]